MKLYSKCRIEKSFSEFYKRGGRESGFRAKCKDCYNLECKVTYVNNAEKVRLRTEKKKDYLKLYYQQYYIKNKITKIKYQKEYYNDNKQNIIFKKKIYYNTNLKYKLSSIRRKRFYRWFKTEGKRKLGSLSNYISYTFEQLKEHLEKQFKPGMSWSNYGEWHVDHIKPLASFDPTKEEDIKKAWALENLQPLWAFDNLSKGKT